MRKSLTRLLAVIMLAVLLVQIFPIAVQAAPAIDDGPPTEDYSTDYIAAQTPGHAIPNYYQNDYPGIRYGAGTIATSGCGITALAMVATYMTGVEYTPDVLAHWFGGKADNNMKRMELGATTLGLPWRKAKNIDVATNALQEGKIVILMVEGYNGRCPFTMSQHFMVIRGMTEDGKYLINDPYKPNYEKWNLKEGFVSGFSRGTILSGYNGAWIFDPDAMPENFKPYQQIDPPWRDNYPGIHLTSEEESLLAKVVWVESRGESLEGQQAVAEVILNRLASGRFGDSLENIIYAPGQFNSVPKLDKATPWQAQYDVIELARFGPQVLEKDVYYFGTSAYNDNLYTKIGGHYFCRGDSPVPQPVTEPPTETTAPAEDTVSAETAPSSQPTVPEETQAPTLPAETTAPTESETSSGTFTPPVA